MVCSVTFWVTALCALCISSCAICVTGPRVVVTYSGASRATRCVYVCKCGDGGAGRPAKLTLLLSSGLPGAGLWASEPRVPSSNCFSSVTSLFQRQNQVSDSPRSVSTLRDSSIGQYKGLYICLAVPVPGTYLPPRPQGPRRCSGYQVAVPAPQDTGRGPLSRGVLPVGVQYGGDTFVGWPSFRDQEKSSEELRLTQPARLAE